MTEQINRLWVTISQYGIYRESVHGGIAEPVALFYNFISVLLIDLPYGLFQLSVGIVSTMVQVLDISSALQPFQKSLMATAQSTFLSLIGGVNGKILGTSVIGVLLSLSVLYLIYQWANGSGNFIKSFLHLVGVVSVMFFFFGNFTSQDQAGRSQHEMGGVIVFNTVNHVTQQAKEAITTALTGVSTADSSEGFIIDYVLKPTTNFINTGNPKGELKNGTTFDYKKAKAQKEQNNDQYVNDTAQANTYMKNDGSVLAFQTIAGVLGGFNLIIYALPIVIVNLLISALGLLVCLLIVLLPIMALMSFIPSFGNAFFNGIKLLLGLSVTPVFLSIMVGVLFYLMTLIDTAVLSSLTGQGVVNFAAAVAGLNPITYLVAMPLIFLIKVGFMVILWKNKKHLAEKVTGDALVTQRFDTTGMEQHLQTVGEKAKGGVMIGAGYLLGQPQLALQGANMVAPQVTSTLQKMKDSAWFSESKAPAGEEQRASASPSESESKAPPQASTQDSASFDEDIQVGAPPDPQETRAPEVPSTIHPFNGQAEQVQIQEPKQGLNEAALPTEEAQPILPFEEGTNEGENEPSTSEGPFSSTLIQEDQTLEPQVKPSGFETGIEVPEENKSFRFRDELKRLRGE